MYNTAENPTELTEEYMKPPACNDYKINDCVKILNTLKVLPLLYNNKEYALYDVDSLFTNNPLK